MAAYGLVSVAGVSALTLDDRQQRALATAYAHPPRAYHNLTHVTEVLGHVDAMAARVPWRQPREVFLAACYHDAIYQPGQRDNEARSADFALAQIAEHLPAAGIDGARVRALILLTARHGKLGPDDVDAEAARFLDCDMAILGADGDAFDRYDRAIAEEYRGVVPAFLFRFQRRRFLRALLTKPRIYLSEEGHALWDANARVNLARALAC